MSYQYPTERVLFNLHHGLCTLVLRQTTRRKRNLAEKLVLFVALCGWGALILAHISLVHGGRFFARSNFDPSTKQTKGSIPLTCLPSIPGFLLEADVTHLSLIDDGSPSRVDVVDMQTCDATNMHASTSSTLPASCSQFEPYRKIHQQQQPHASTSDDSIIFSYSKVEGYLLLEPKLRSKHNITVQHVKVSVHDEKCFGEPFLQTIVFRIVGPNVVMINWLLGYYDNQGFIYHERTRTLYDLSQYTALKPDVVKATLQPLHFWASGPDRLDAAEKQDQEDHYRAEYAAALAWSEQIMWKFSILLKTSFLYFIATTFVSFTLRETQERMLDFTQQLQQHVRSGQSVVTLVVTHVVENLVFVPIMVGIIFFLIEFYRGDTVLAFWVLSIVWISEAFSVMSLRTSKGMQHFPITFFILFSVFHYYVFAFPFGFHYTALASTASILFHAMLFVWHRYELPAVALGLVSVERPRMSLAYSPPRSPPSIPTLHGDRSRRNLARPIISLSPRRWEAGGSVNAASGSQPRLHQRHVDNPNPFSSGYAEDALTNSFLYDGDGSSLPHQRRLSPSSITTAPTDENSHPLVRERHQIESKSTVSSGVGSSSSAMIKDTTEFESRRSTTPKEPRHVPLPE